jgi:hypothetical protein
MWRVGLEIAPRDEAGHSPELLLRLMIYILRVHGFSLSLNSKSYICSIMQLYACMSLLF